MNKSNAGAGLSALDQVRKVQPSFDGDRSDRQNLADTVSSPDRNAHMLLTPPTESDRLGFVDQDAVTPLARPPSARTSDPLRVGQSGWFQRSEDGSSFHQQEILIPKSGPSGITIGLAATAAAIVVGGVLWLLLF